MFATYHRQGFPTPNTSSPVQSRYARLNAMEDTASNDITSFPPLRQSSSNTLAETADKQASERFNGGQVTRLAPSCQKHGGQTFLDDDKATLRQMSDEIIQAARTYHSKDEAFDINAMVAEARVMYHRCMHAVRSQDSASRQGLHYDRTVEKIFRENNFCQKALGKVKHFFKVLKQKRNADRDEKSVMDLWDDIVFARSLFGQAVHGGYVF